MAEDPNIIKAGSSVLATNVKAECPACHDIVEIPVRLTIINSLPASMLLWSHDHPFMCAQCRTAFTISITQVDVRSLGWQPVAVALKEKPLIETPNNFDVSRILKN